MDDMLSESQCEKMPSVIGGENALVGPPSIERRLKEQKSVLERRLQAVNEGLDTLSKNPELAASLEKITKALRA